MRRHPRAFDPAAFGTKHRPPHTSRQIITPIGLRHIFSAITSACTAKDIADIYPSNIPLSRKGASARLLKGSVAMAKFLYVVSDALIALAYYAIPVILIYFVRKRHGLRFNRMFLMCGALIIACGTTHLVGVWTLWFST
jgi:hypothetical protein